MATSREHLAKDPTQLKDIASKTPPAPTVEPGLFPRDGKFSSEKAATYSDYPTKTDIKVFADAIKNRDYAAALSAASKPLENVDDNWIPLEIDYADLQNPDKLKEFLTRMDSLGKATRVTAGTAIEINCTYMADVVVRLPDGTKINLASGTVGDIKQTTEADPLGERLPEQLQDSNAPPRKTEREVKRFVQQRPATPSEQAMIDLIRRSPAGEVLLGRMALTAFEERLVHAKQRGVLSDVTKQFQASERFKNLQEYAARKFTDTAKREEFIQEALREIDVAATLYEQGLSRESIQQLLGQRHMTGEREFFYEWLREQPARENLQSGKQTEAPNGWRVAGEAPEGRGKVLYRKHGVSEAPPTVRDLPPEFNPEKPIGYTELKLNIDGSAARYFMDMKTQEVFVYSELAITEGLTAKTMTKTANVEVLSAEQATARLSQPEQRARIPEDLSPVTLASGTYEVLEVDPLTGRMKTKRMHMGTTEVSKIDELNEKNLDKLLQEWQRDLETDLERLKKDSSKEAQAEYAELLKEKEALASVRKELAAGGELAQRVVNHMRNTIEPGKESPRMSPVRGRWAGKVSTGGGVVVGVAIIVSASLGYYNQHLSSR